jgi:hypothetical protein
MKNSIAIAENMVVKVATSIPLSHVSDQPSFGFAEHFF